MIAGTSSAEPLIAAVVIARNEERTIVSCVAASKEGLAAVGGGSVLVVDSASTDRTAELALETGCRVYTIRKASRFGPSAARRIGESLTQSRYVLFLDGDCELEPGFLPLALQELESDGALGVIAGQRADFYRTRKGIVAAPGEYYERDRTGESGEIRYGGCALYRRSALRKAGSFNPFLRSQEEADLAQRLQRLGFRASVLSKPMIRHTTVPRESLGRLLRTLRHGFFLGRGQAVRLFLGRGEFRAAFQDMSRVLATLVHLAVGLVCLHAWIVGGTGWPLFAWSGLSLAVFTLFVVRGRSLHRAVYYVLEWIVQGLYLVPGFLTPVAAPASFRWAGEERVAAPSALQSLPRVLLVGPRPDPPYRGGVEKGVDLLLRTDVAKRTSMRVFNNYRRRDPGRRLWARLTYQASMLRAFWREVRSHPVDLVHVKTSSGINFHQNALYALAARLAGRPVVMQIHCGKFSSFYHASPAPLRAWIRHTLTSVRQVVVLSRGLETTLRAIVPTISPVVVPNGLPEHEIVDHDPGEDVRGPQVLFVGTGEADLNSEKGLEDLVAVLPGLADRFRNATWVLAGLPDAQAIRRLLETALPEAARGESLRCMGLVDDETKGRLLRSSTILVMPSYFENMPNILLESMAAGMGVVATRVGAIPEMLGDGRGGILFNPGDRQALQDSLSLLLGEPRRALEQGRWNRRTVLQRYTMKAVERSLEPVYREAAGWSPPGGLEAAPSEGDHDRPPGRIHTPETQRAIPS